MAETNLKKNKEGYGYKYTELAEINGYLDKNDMKYIQFIKRIDNEDYIFTKRYVDGKWEDEALQGCKVVQAILSGKSNPAQEQGSALTYARRYSLLMAFGLATEDDDAECLTKAPQNKKATETTTQDPNGKVTAAQAKTIYALMMKKGLDVAKQLEVNFGIKNTADLTVEQCNSIYKKIKDLPDKQ